MKIQGLIVAAGQSSRMGAVKPLLELEGYALIERSIFSLKNAGVEEIVVVLGKNAPKVQGVIAPHGVRIVVNENYAATDMLRSIQLGLSLCRDAQGVFLLPGDLPMVSPHTVAALKAAFVTEQPAVVYPLLKGERAHPPLLAQKTYGDILGFAGSGGLRAALSPWQAQALNVPCRDAGCGLDADTPDEYRVLAEYARVHSGISPEMCQALFERAKLPPHIRAHTRAVAACALELARALIGCGRGLDLQLIQSGALLHDLYRLEPRHAHVAAAHLRRLGYLAIADVVAQHDTLKDIEFPRLNEATIVFLADKLVQQTTRVRVEARYARALEAYPANSPIGRRVREDIKKCNALLREYEAITHENLYE